MAAFEYVNLVYWLIALASLVAWARFATFMAEDVTNNLVDQPEIPWKIGAAAVGVVMLIVWVAMPSFWIALPVNAVIAGGMIGAYWALRVKTLGAGGHLMKETIQAAGKVSKSIEQKKNARQVLLTYLRHDNSLMPLPRPDDPLAAGLGIADSMVIQALARRAEVLELGPAKEGYALTLVTDGMPTVQPAVERGSAEAAIQALKVLSGLSADERRRPQMGKFRTRDAEGNTTVWTVRTSGSMAGERAILTANEKGQWDLPLDQLGFTTEQLSDVKKLVSTTNGLVLVTGPRGHGRSTTMYSMLKQHDAFTNSVETLEVNPQLEIEGVTINRFGGTAGGGGGTVAGATGMGGAEGNGTYSKLLQSIMLKEPNVLMVSQIPDSATADLITKFTSESTGESRRVYTTLTAADSFSAIEMWLAMNANKLEAAKALRAVIAQRLIRILCPTCKIPYQPDEAMMKRLNLPVGRNMQSFKANTEPIVDRKGNKIICPDCAGIGFRGRTAIFEVLMITDEMKQAIAGGGGMNQIRVLARKNNLMLLVEHGIRKFATGLTAIHEVTRVISTEKGGNPAGTKAGTRAAK